VNRANSLVGVAESAAIPVGYVVDRRPDQRAHLLRLSTGIALLAVICGIVVVATDEMIVVFAMLICFGLFMELASSASEAIFADSIPAGERAALFVTKSVISTVGAACGPGIAAVGLALLGDKWEPYQIKIIMVLGLLLMLPTILPLFIFHDPKLSPVANGVNGASPESRQSTEDAESAQSSPISRARLKCLNSKHVPFILALSDFITCIGAGMTVKFFNLFFIQDEHFSPVAISLLQTAYPLVIAGFMKITERLAKPLGRPQASLTFFSLNVLCLLLMAEVRWLPALLLVFLVRGGMANSTYPIDRSILMDFTPSSQRGMWNAVSSLTSMTWSGSAFLGGVLSDARDYRYTFLITALVYASACLVYLPLLYLVPRKEKEAANASVTASAEPCNDVSANNLRQWKPFGLCTQVRIGPPLVSVTISTVYSYACLATQACACSIEKKVYLAAVDRWGNACSFINSNYMGFGTGIVPEGCGFTLQNRNLIGGHNFILKEGHPNCVGPRQFGVNERAAVLAHRISMAADSKDLFCTLGVMGGFMQPQGHLQASEQMAQIGQRPANVLCAMADYGLDPQAALDQPRVDSVIGAESAETAQLLLEEGLPQETQDGLRALGHDVVVVTGWQRLVFGRGQVICGGLR
ncbi:unnamed protein product, partial [Cladocopium goreaui]